MISDGGEENLYDRTYLENKDGVYTYRLTDESIIERYDELYSDAFKDVIDIHNNRIQWLNQEFTNDQEIYMNNLLFNRTNDNSVISVGNDFEMDYDFDLLNVGYTFADLDSDGSYELIFGVLHNKYDEGNQLNSFERAYTLINSKAVRFYEGGNRDYYWLGSDGYIYNYGSGGAVSWGVSRVHLDKTEIVSTDNVDWGNSGFVEDEVVGYEVIPIHINGSLSEIEDATDNPEIQVTEEEVAALVEEWESRQVNIEWIPFGNYLKEHYPSGIG